ncbi:MAG TPA: pseudaminic acid cytidylyltransferase [Rhodobacteraceae bacterium]|nr:pseudaminic acid cytidylyltransferase [Paracoccaceae bacterium]
MRVAVIPARGGSKRIPRKNIKPFCGEPMIAWSIKAAQDSGCFDRIIVSTDDTEITDVARQYGAEVPFIRPASLSDDHTGTTPVIRHAIEWLGQNGPSPDTACCIYATAPFIRASDILDGLAALEGDYAFSVTNYAFPIQRAVRVTPANQIEMFNPEEFLTRSQDMEEAYHDAGQFYWGTASAWLAERPIFGASSTPVILPRHRVQDIDTPEDWVTAEWMFKAMAAK